MSKQLEPSWVEALQFTKTAMTKERPVCHDSYCYCWITPFIHWRWHNRWQGKTWCRMTAQVTNRRIKKDTGLHLFMTVPVVCSIFFILQGDTFYQHPSQLLLSLYFYLYALLYTYSDTIFNYGNFEHPEQPNETGEDLLKEAWKIQLKNLVT